MITSMREHKGHLYLGGIQNNRIGRYKLDGADPDFVQYDTALGKGPMIAALHAFGDRVLGRGEASITIPIFDGALKPNQILARCRSRRPFRRCQRHRHRRRHAPGRRRRASRPRRRAARDGGRPLRPHDVTALCALPGGGLAVALGGQEVRIEGGAADGRRWTRCRRRALPCRERDRRPPTARSPSPTARSATIAPDWTHDLMDRGASGRLVFLDPRTGDAREAAHGPGICLRRLRLGRRDARLRELAPSPARHRAGRPAPHRARIACRSIPRGWWRPPVAASG